MATSPIFHRAELLLGSEALDRLRDTRVILFGVGGVGSWCAEGLIRSGVGQLTIVDSDLVCITNVNRQLQATSFNVGKSKVEELRDRLTAINPNAKIEALQHVYKPDTRDFFDLDSYDYVIDAIDSLSCKIDLIASCLQKGKTIYSAMGAALKMDPTRIKVGSIWKTKHCPLAREVRKGLRKRNVADDFLCVYSEELLPNQVLDSACGTGKCYCPKSEGESTDVWCSTKAQINGSLVHITATFGFHLCGLVVRDCMKRG